MKIVAQYLDENQNVVVEFPGNITVAQDGRVFDVWRRINGCNKVPLAKGLSFDAAKAYVSKLSRNI